MSDGKPSYTDFKDPFDLLNELRNMGLERIYKNTFARGNRSAIEDENSGTIRTTVGKTFTPNYRLQADAPSSMWEARQGSGRTLPPPGEINFNRDYGDPGIDRRELKRFGSAAKKVGESLQSMTKVFYDRRQADKKAKEDFTAIESLRPSIARLHKINEEMGTTKQQMEDLSMSVKQQKLDEKHRKQVEREDAAAKKAQPPQPPVAPATTPTSEPLSTTDKIRRNARGTYSKGTNTETLKLATSPAVGEQPIGEQPVTGAQPMAPQAEQKQPARIKKMAMRAAPPAEVKPKPKSAQASAKPKRPTLKATPKQPLDEK